MTDTSATIERLRELHAKASADSPGEWMPTHDLDSEDTAVYIAESHNFLPALLDRLEKLEVVAKLAKRILDERNPDKDDLQKILGELDK